MKPKNTKDNKKIFVLNKAQIKQHKKTFESAGFEVVKDKPVPMNKKKKGLREEIDEIFWDDRPGVNFVGDEMVDKLLALFRKEFLELVGEDWEKLTLPPGIWKTMRVTFDTIDKGDISEAFRCGFNQAKQGLREKIRGMG